ncbi:MAG: DHA2 family efflux MFS transporter permease subunit [Actinomycetota bacterium]|nr:DHA2 family efflux MFS transporter permease subunit [Actinomycetota bacterium]
MTSNPHRWRILAVVATAFFMTILDVSIVNVALPSISRALHFSRENLQWVITAYAIALGGFLLLAGRAADLLGRRRVFMVGVALFTIASLACGLAQSEGMLIVARAVQGLGGAIITPAALSIVMTSFEEGAERNKALGIWGALGGSGAAVGVLAGGVLTKYLGWEWIFFVNVPVGALVLVLTSRIVPESRREGAERRYDALGAVLVSGGLALLVYTISRAPDIGWATARTILLLIASGALLVAFLVNERRHHDPLMPFQIFRVRTVTGANVVGALLGAVIFANFFLLTLYVQNVLHYSALKAGVTFVATAGTAVLSAGVAQALTTKVGPKPVIAVGLVLLTGGMIWYTQIPVDGSYASDLLPGYVMVGVGLAFSFVPVSIAALAGVAEREAGLASGLINTSQQIGGAIGVAVASTVFTTHFKTLVEDGKPLAVALTGGYRWAFWALAFFAALAFIAAVTLIKGEEMAEAPAAPSRS